MSAWFELKLLQKRNWKMAKMAEIFHDRLENILKKGENDGSISIISLS